MRIPEVWITIGKRGFNDENLKKLKDYDIAGIRINTGRSAHDWSYQTIAKLIDMGYQPEQIYLDIGNKKPRLTLENSEKIDVHISDFITISKVPNEKSIGWLYNSIFFDEVSLADTVYFGDGEIECSVVEIKRNYIQLRALSEGTITNNVAIGIVGKKLEHFFIDANEIKEINSILSDFPVSLILSFVEKSENILWAREQFFKAYNIIPKIETAAAIENFRSIIETTNIVFIGRGDLGLDIGLEKIGIIQKKLISIAHEAECYVALGTGTLDSLKWSQVPLRAEVIDITNSCYERVDALVLTSETAGSITPFKAIDFLMKTLAFISQQ